MEGHKDHGKPYRPKVSFENMMVKAYKSCSAVSNFCMTSPGLRGHGVGVTDMNSNPESAITEQEALSDSPVLLV